MSKPEANSRFTTFVADPANPVVNQYTVSGAHDYRKLAERSDVLTFDTPRLERDTEVTGPIQAHMFISCDCRDVDLWVRLLDVAPDGTALNLMSPGLDVQRASNREPARAPQWLIPKKIYQVDLNNLITSNTFLAGHRIRAQVSASFFPNFSRNLQNGNLRSHRQMLTRLRLRSIRIRRMHRNWFCQWLLRSSGHRHDPVTISPGRARCPLCRTWRTSWS